LRIDFDDLMEKYAAASVEERAFISPRAVMSSALGVEIDGFTMDAKRVKIRIDPEDFDLTSLMKHTFVRNKREIGVFQLDRDRDGRVEITYAAITEGEAMDETKLRDAAALAMSMIESADRYARYNPDATREMVKRVIREATPQVDPTSVLVEEESNDRLALLREQRRGQCFDEPKRSAVKGAQKVAYTDRQSAKAL
jgi:hypothetical protein